MLDTADFIPDNYVGGFQSWYFAAGITDREFISLKGLLLVTYFPMKASKNGQLS